jgi:hypothetical protein
MWSNDPFRPPLATVAEIRQWARRWWWLLLQILVALLLALPWPFSCFGAVLWLALGDCFFGCIFALVRVVQIFQLIAKATLAAQRGKALLASLLTLFAIPFVIAAMTLVIAPFVSATRSIAEGGETAAGALAMILSWTIPTGALLTSNLVHRRLWARRSPNWP